MPATWRAFAPSSWIGAGRTFASASARRRPRSPNACDRSADFFRASSDARSILTTFALSMVFLALPTICPLEPLISVSISIWLVVSERMRPVRVVPSLRVMTSTS